MPVDAPIFIPDRTPEDLDGDPFAIGPVADRVASIIRAVQPPFTISLAGSWGVGKTTLVEQVKRMLPAARIVSIDAWTEDLPQLRRKLAVELGAAIAAEQDEESKRQARVDTAAALDKATRGTITDDLEPKLEFGAFRKLWPRAEASPWRTLAFIYGFLAFAAATLIALGAQWTIAPVLAAVLTALAVFLVVGSGQVVSVRTSKQSLAPATEALTLGSELRRLIRRSTPQAEPVLLVVDNLDRLGGADAMSVLADIRAFVDDPESRCIFLIPIDREAFARSVGPLVGGSRSARDYLEKFFGLDIQLTKPAGLDLRSWTRDLLASVFPGHRAEDRSAAAELVAAAAVGSPRAAKRMVNGMSARYWLIDPELRPSFTLAQLAVLEGLIAQFPHAAAVTARDARALADAREALRGAADDQARANALDALALPGPSDQDSDQDYDARRTLALRDFLLLADPIPLSVEDIGTVLSLRDDRSMQGVPNATAVKAAIRAGQPDEVATAIADFTSEQRSLTFLRAAEIAEEDNVKGFRASAIAIINAIAPHVDDAGIRENLRRTAIETLLGTQPVLMRTLPEATIDLVFSDDRQDARLDSLATRAAGELAANQGEPRQGLVRILAAAGGRLAPDTLTYTRTALAALPTDELEPLFSPHPHPSLVPGDIEMAMIRTLAGWTPAASEIETSRLASRLMACLNAGMTRDDALDPIASQVQTQVLAVTTSSIPMLETLVGLLEHAAPGPNVDALAQTLVGWSGDPAVGLRLGSGLPFSAAVNSYVVNAATTFIQSRPKDEINPVLVARRKQIRAAGADVPGPLARRWIAGEGVGFLDLAIADGDADGWDAVRVNLATASAAALCDYATEAAEAARACSAPNEVLVSIRDVVAGKLGGLTPGQMSGLGPALAALDQAGCDIAPVVAQLVSRIGSAAAGEITEWVAVTQSIVAAVPASSGALVPAIVTRGAALGEMDLDRVPWLIRAGADPDGLRTAVCAEIVATRRSPQEVAASSSIIRTSLKSKWQVREALVIRAMATNAADAARPLVHAALEYEPVPKTKRQTYDEALAAIAGLGGLDDELARLRA